MRSVDRPSRSVKRPRRFVEDEDEDEDEQISNTKTDEKITAQSVSAKSGRTAQKETAPTSKNRPISTLIVDVSSPYSKRDRQPKSTSDEFVGGVQSLIPKVRKPPPGTNSSLQSPQSATTPRHSVPSPTVQLASAPARRPAQVEPTPPLATEGPSVKKTRGRKPKQQISAFVSPQPAPASDAGAQATRGAVLPAAAAAAVPAAGDAQLTSAGVLLRFDQPRPPPPPPQPSAAAPAPAAALPASPGPAGPAPPLPANPSRVAISSSLDAGHAAPPSLPELPAVAAAGGAQGHPGRDRRTGLFQPRRWHAVREHQVDVTGDANPH